MCWGVLDAEVGLWMLVVLCQCVEWSATIGASGAPVFQMGETSFTVMMME
jgi:hypothetical protein